MVYQRIHKSSPWNSQKQAQAQDKSFQLSPHPFTVQTQQDSHKSLTQEEAENEAFNQYKFEALGLQLKEKNNTITPLEQEKLGVLQAKMDGFWITRMERAKAQPNLLGIIVYDSQAKQTIESQSPIQSNLGTAKQNGKNDNDMYQVGSNDQSEEKKVNALAEEMAQPKTSEVVVQRMIEKVTLSSQGVIKVKANRKRPLGGLSKGSQGDHTTPYTTLQHGIINAIEDESLTNAWMNLVATHSIYTMLPGYKKSNKWLQEASNNLLSQNRSIDPDGVAAEEIKEYANELLKIRNRVALSSLPTTGGTTGGNNEQNTSGALQHLERRLRKRDECDFSKEDVIITMWNTIDFERLLSLHDEEKQEAILKQHKISILDSYPLITEKFGITSDDLTEAQDRAKQRHHNKKKKLSKKPSKKRKKSKGLDGKPKKRMKVK